MKLKFTHSVVLFIGALMVILIGAGIILGSLQFNEIPIRMEGQGFFTLTRIGLMLAGILTILFSGFCLTLPHRMKQTKADYVLQKTPTGEMRISVHALTSIIQKSLSQYDEIKIQDLIVHSTKRGVEVDLRAYIANNINIPQAVEEIQKHVKQQLLATSGIDAREIRVIIVKADHADNKSKFQIDQNELNLKKD